MNIQEYKYVTTMNILLCTVVRHWRTMSPVNCKKTSLYAAFWLTKTFLCVNIYIRGHVCVLFSFWLDCSISTQMFRPRIMFMCIITHWMTCLHTFFDLCGYAWVQFGTELSITSTAAKELWGVFTQKDVTRTCLYTTFDIQASESVH